MPFYLSPSVNVFEKDLTSIVPAVSTSVGAFAGAFSWGPVESPVTISSENVLAQTFGKPNDSTFTSFFTAANFLSYSNNLLTVRANGAGLKNAIANPTTVVFLIKNEDDYMSSYSSGQGNVGPFAAKYPGTLGNSIAVIVFDAQAYSYAKAIKIVEKANHAAILETTNEAGTVYVAKDTDKVYKWDTSATPAEYAEVSGETGTKLKLKKAIAGTFDGVPSTSDYASRVGGSNDEIHIAIIDEDGLWSGTKGYILEKYSYLSKASGAVKSDGTNNYYKDVLNSTSKYVWWMDHILDTWGSAPTTNFSVNMSDIDASKLLMWSLSGGADYTSTPAPAPAPADLQTAYSIFANDELYDISLVLTGKIDSVTANYIVSNLVEARKDCIAFFSPFKDGNPIIGNGSEAVEDIKTFKDAINASTSYAVIDTGCKYQYDRYNDVYRWVPLNGDIAGLCARTDYTNDAWWSPAGYNRGQIKNVVKLAVNPGKTERDDLYKNGINPVVNFPGNGVVLFGDKTMLTKPSAFDRINVRRLFIVLEKAIATAAKYQLFEFNDSFTRAQFKNLVEPFLRDVQGRRGIIDFRVKCDETNNTGEVIDRNEFVADIFIKPSRSINYITLNFVAARTGISFEEIGA
jgi:phage tail sheath protein FI